MISDITTMIWKEAKEFIVQRPGMRGGRIGILIFIIIFGVVIPLQSGLEWLTSPGTLLLWAWLPFLLVNGVVADAVAGERERHTLETLLASRLSDRAILYGKISAAIIYGWGFSLMILIVGVITVNLAHWQGRPTFFTAPAALAILSLSFLVAVLAASLGVLVSLHASTARQAQQTLSGAFLLVLIPLLLFPMLPTEWQLGIAQTIERMDWSALLLAATAFLVVLDLALLAIVTMRFRRTQLILD